jgi:hypothetical protein
MLSAQHALVEAREAGETGNRSTFKELLRLEPEGGTTNIQSKHWARWLGVENRCLVPFNFFSESNKPEGAATRPAPSPVSPVSGRTSSPSVGMIAVMDF